jgi:hypothetical protein
MPGVGCDEDDERPVDRQFLESRPRERDVTVVRRVEGPTKDAVY